VGSAGVVSEESSKGSPEVRGVLGHPCEVLLISRPIPVSRELGAPEPINILRECVAVGAPPNVVTVDPVLESKRE
jgi:hypothetical protein